MARIAGINIPENKHLVIALTEIFGIGRTKSRHILSVLKIKEDERLKNLNDDLIDKIRSEVSNHSVEGELRRQIRMNINHHHDIGSYKGRRHNLGLPVNGQRTKTNAKTRKGPSRKAIKK